MSNYNQLLDDADKLEAKAMLLFQEVSVEYSYTKEVQASEALKNATNKRMEAFDMAGIERSSYTKL